MTAMPNLVGDVVSLTAWEPAFVPALVEACNDPDIRAWASEGFPVPYTEADALAYVALCAQGWVTGTQFTFAVIERATARVAGSVRVGESAHGATAGYWTGPWSRRRGVATEALRLVTSWGRAIGLWPVRCYIDPENRASRRVAEKVGYQVDPSGRVLDPEGRHGDLVFVTPTD